MSPSPPTANGPPRLTAPGARSLLGAVLAAVTLLAAIAQLMHGGVFANSAPQSGLNPATFALAAGATLPLVVWWRWPRGVFVAAAAASVLLVGAGQPLDMALGPAVALFLLAADPHGGPGTMRRTGLLATVLFTGFLAAAGVSQGGFPGVEMVHSGLAWSGAWFAGDRTRLRREQVAELRQRADRAERDVEQERLLAVAEERTRIARDLHDSAGHAISLIAVRSGAARLRNDPQRSQAALEAVEDLARQTVADIDLIVGGLRESGEEDLVTPHGLSSLDTLLTQHRAGGLAVKVAFVGTRRPLRAATDQAAYRILQESLTNAARHGTGTAHVRVGFDDAGVELSISNPIKPKPGDRDNDRAGHGLVGMKERATLLAGRFESGVTSGVFRVLVWIPDGGRAG